MSGFLAYFLFGLGLIMIIKGSDWFIDGVIWVSSVFKIPYIIIGATIVSICTTLPETFVSVTAAIKGQTDFAFGNVIGSIAVNTGFIMAIIIIFSKPIIENKKDFIKNGFLLMGLMILVFIVGITLGEINRYIGGVLLLLLVIYLINNIIAAKKSMSKNLKYEVEIEEEEDMVGGIPLQEGVALDLVENELDISKKTITKYLVYFFVGISLVIGGSILLVDNGIKIAELLGVPSILIAVTFTAIGTSLPELVTTITSIRKKATSLGVGTIIGASTLNIILSVALSSTITPIPLNLDPSILYVRIPITLAIITMAILFGVLSKNGYKRWQGFVLLAAYIVFLVLNIIL